jgi:hypothetical protein
MAFDAGIIFSMMLMVLLTGFLIATISYEIVNDEGIQQEEHGIYVGIGIIWGVGIVIAVIILIYSYDISG